jgi:hypothetical protein
MISALAAYIPAARRARPGQSYPRCLPPSIGIEFISFSYKFLGQQTGLAGSSQTVSSRQQLAARVFERRSTAVLVDLYCTV